MPIQFRRFFVSPLRRAVIPSFHRVRHRASGPIAPIRIHTRPKRHSQDDRSDNEWSKARKQTLCADGQPNPNYSPSNRRRRPMATHLSISSTTDLHPNVGVACLHSVYIKNWLELFNLRMADCSRCAVFDFTYGLQTPTAAAIISFPCATNSSIFSTGWILPALHRHTIQRRCAHAKSVGAASPTLH